ncbi:MAG: hypothetical protein AB1400_05410 [Pseudomonadota bacterium]
MKKIFIVDAVVVAVSIWLYFSDGPWRWVMLFGSSASQEAQLLLSGHEGKNDKFKDYLIYTVDNCVVFVNQKTVNRTMVYCPKNIPADTTKTGALTHLVDDWYVAQ